MSGARENSDEEGFDFNDLTRQASDDKQADQTEARRGSQEDGNEVPKPKRIACVLCRKRKLKCDSKRPSCSTCVRLQHDCSYDEVRKKSGPKRGYVKALEARLAQVETLLKTQDDPPVERRPSNTRKESQQSNGVDSVGPIFHPNIAMRSSLDGKHNMLDEGLSMPADESFPWEMIGLGLDEPLPTQDVIDDLNKAYFDKIHPSLPMIHRPRYYAAMNLAPHMRPPIALRYAMWALSASQLDKYESLQEHFYNRARKYLQQDEMRGHGENMITVAHAQAWILIATFEFKMMFFPRAWMSAGRASRLSLMMGLHRIDGFGLDVKQCLPPSKDNTDREERRRTFWMAFCVDRYSSIGTGWPMVIEEKDITTNLPGDEDSFENNLQPKILRLDEVLEPQGVPSLTAASGIVLMACLFGRNLTHLHRPGPDDNDDDLNGGFWRRHRAIDNILLGTALGLPEDLRLPKGNHNPNVVFINMSIHTSTICLHQAAIFKADKNRMPARISAESKVRCITAAAEIATIMRTISHVDLSTVRLTGADQTRGLTIAQFNPFISFCLYVASRVFVQYLKSRPRDTQVRSSLQFLLAAMHAIKRKNPLTESFLVQLDVDLEGAGLEDTKALRASLPPFQPGREMPGCPFSELANGDNGRQHAFAYGDQGVAVYNNPNDRGPAIVPSQASNNNTFSYNSEEMPDLTAFASTTQFHIPHRQRTPGSSTYHSSSNDNYNTHQQSGVQEMDTSPDNSGRDQNTPSSSSLQNVSSHTSNTGYSPPTDQSFLQHNLLPFDTLNSNISTSFDMNSYPATANHQQESGYILPANWGSTGLTPSMNTGLTPGATTGMTPAPDLLNMGMTEAEWQQMIDGFTNGAGSDNWSSTMTMEHSEQMEALLASRR